MTDTIRRPADFARFLELSQRIGRDILKTQGAGGNTSIKHDGSMWVKASGTWLSQAGVKDIMVPVEVAPLVEALRAGDPRAEKATDFVIDALNESGLRPSIETSFHAVLKNRVVAHYHCVNTIAQAVVHDRQAGFERRMAALPDLRWVTIPYRRPGVPLAREIEKVAEERPDVLVLFNHGIIVCGDTVDEVAERIERVSAVMASEPRAAGEPAMDALAAAAEGSGFKPAADRVSHRLALDAASTTIAAGGSLYPDHVIFLGTEIGIMQDGQRASDLLATYAKRGTTAPKLLIMPGQGVLVSEALTAGGEVMARCLADVATRAMMYNDPCPDTQIVDRIAAVAPPDSPARGANSGLARAIHLRNLHPEASIVHQADWLAMQLGLASAVSDENNALKTGYDLQSECWPQWLADAGMVAEKLPGVVRAGAPVGFVGAAGEALGLPKTCRIHAGTTDGCASFLATGASEVGDAVTALGSTLVLKLASLRPLNAAEFGIYAHRVLDFWLETLMTELAPVITLSDLVDRYDVFFVDQFGVLRDDKDAYPGAAETLRHLKSLGKTVVILSNSGRSGEYNAERFTKLGFSRDSFDVFMTSGDAAYAVLSSQGSPVANGASCFTISSGGDHNLADRLGLVSAMEPAEADLLIISGSEAEKVPMEAYEKILRTAVQRGIEAVCTNPDIHKLADGKTAPGAGAIALLYEKLGGKAEDAIFIGIVLLLNGCIGTLQEYSAGKAAAALRKLEQPQATVMRDGQVQEVEARSIVPGDLVQLEAGIRVPADIILIEAVDLLCDESLLTGESLPVRKASAGPGKSGKDPEITVFAGTLVTRGRGKGVARATGLNTELGRIASELGKASVTQPPLMIRLARFSTIIAWTVGVAAVMLIIVGLLHDLAWSDLFLMAVGLAVSAIPEGLPIAISIALAISMRRMAKRHVIVRHMPAVEALGSCTMIATDKTGTLTLNELTVTDISLPDGTDLMVDANADLESCEISGSNLEPAEANARAVRLLRAATLPNEGTLVRDGDAWKGLGDTVDVALLAAGRKAGVTPQTTEKEYPLVARIPYEPDLKYAASFHSRGDRVGIFVKGSAETLIEMAGFMDIRGDSVPIQREILIAQKEEMAKRGLRVLAFAEGETMPLADQAYGSHHLAGLVFLGLAGMQDPIRPEVPQAIRDCQAAGVEVAMVTGDDPRTAAAIATQAGLTFSSSQVTTGDVVSAAEKIGPAELDKLTRETRIYARVAPDQKLAIVLSLTRNGHFVAVTGDGVNDAPALKHAHVGVAMGRNGTDVAKESADIVVTDDNFASIVSGIREGRAAYSNIRKVILMLVATGAAEMLLFLLAIPLGLPMPLLPVQLLWLNLVTNGIQDVTLAAEKPEGDELKRPPRRPKEPIFDRLMIRRIAVSTAVIGGGGFSVFYWLLAQGYEVAYARNLLLLLFVMFENVQTLTNRSERRSVFAMPLLGNPLLLLSVLAAQGLHVAAMYIPWFRDTLELSPISVEAWAAMLAASAVLLLVSEMNKRLERSYRGLRLHRLWKIAAAIIAIAALVYGAWVYRKHVLAAELMQGIASGNGRIEAVEIDIAARTAGRIATIAVREGDFVDAGQVLATLDLEQLQAQKREAEAQLHRAKISVDTAQSVVTQRQAEKEAAAAAVSQSQVQLQSAEKRLARSQQLSRSGSVSEQTLDDDRARVDGAAASLGAAKANLAATDAAIGAAQSQVVDGQAAVEAAQATIDRVEVDLRDGRLKAPRSGRIQYLVAQPGEVVAAGGRVLNMLDVGDVYMTFFLPTADAGRTAIGSDARIVLDAAPQYVLPARISFVSDVSQFTPKTVETQEEREKLMFRLKAQVNVLGGDMRRGGDRRWVCPAIAYMPQGLGKNLYPTLSAFENADFFGRLFGQPSAERRQRIEMLFQRTGLAGFEDRPAGKLSGGMKQKLSLCCALIHDPELLILDEPTTGVDPLSRRQFWDLISDIRKETPSISVIVATAYMGEAERFDWLAAVNDGKLLATGSPADLLARTGAASLDDAFVALLPEREDQYQPFPSPAPLAVDDGQDYAIEAQGLTMRFGDFTAVDNVSFKIRRGEIFGFLGSNGCGKSTTMKMLTGLLPASEGTAKLFGKPTTPNDLEVRRRVGYMSQGFSLYSELTVRENLELHAHLFGLPKSTILIRVDDLADRFQLTQVMDTRPDSLPLGVRQRLSLAVALIHSPEVLILDEPTSGVDPIAREQLWRTLTELSRKDKVTIFISTHFMNEAERCDRISLMHAGQVLVSDSPAAIRSQRNAATLEDAFVGWLRDASADAEAPAPPVPELKGRPPANVRSGGLFDPGRALSYSRREALELGRDRIRATLALIGSVILMFVVGYGINMDVKDLEFAVLDQDDTTASRDYVADIAGSPYFVEQPPLTSYADLDQRMKGGSLKLALEIPAGFAEDISRGLDVEVGAWIDGAMPQHAETTQGYVQGMHGAWLARQMRERQGDVSSRQFVTETRFRYNPGIESLVAMVPAVIPLLLLLIPAMLTALSIVREKELGSIVNFYVTPVTQLEFLVGKQLPYLALGVFNATLLWLFARFVFQVPFTGSLITFAAAALLYLGFSTAFGLLVSTFMSSQIAAIFGTTLMTMLPAVQFSGMIDPVTSLQGLGAAIGQIYPTTYFSIISRGTFSKGLGFESLSSAFLPLLARAVPQALNNAPIAIVDEDRSPLSRQIGDAFLPPYFKIPVFISAAEMDARMDAGADTFAVNIPPHFQSDLIAGKAPVIQLNVDATRMTQAFSGSGYIQSILSQEVARFSSKDDQQGASVSLSLRARYNPELNQIWFASVMNVINNITMLSIILAGTALIREREHGTIEHLLVMPVTPLEIMLGKVWSMGLVVLIASGLSLVIVVQGLLRVPIEGSISLFMAGTTLHLLATTALGIALATVAGSMPQFGMLLVLVLLPLQILSGATTPRESMPDLIQTIMLAAPNTHFIAMAQAILYRGLQIRFPHLRLERTLHWTDSVTQELARLTSGIPGLDPVLGGGFIEGASYIIQGHPGAGKTIFSNQIAFANADRGRRVLYITLLAETHERLFQALGTLDFFDRARLGTDISYISVFQTLRDEGLSAVVTLIRQEISRQGATLLVFDGLLSARDRADTDLDVKTFVAEVQSQAAFAGCTVLFLTSTRISEESPEHTMVDGVIELHDELSGVRSVRRMQVKKSRGSAALGGYHQFEISSSGVRVFPRLEAAVSEATLSDHHQGEGVSSRTPGLDALIGGGLPRSSITLIFGPSGSGKTSFGLNFLSGASAEEPALHFGFYETPARLSSKAASLGLDLEPLLASGTLEMVWNPLTENMLDKLGRVLLDAVRVRNVKRLFIDGLGGFERAAVYRPRLVEFFAALTNELRALGVTTIATWELPDLFGPTASLCWSGYRPTSQVWRVMMSPRDVGAALAERDRQQAPPVPGQLSAASPSPAGPETPSPEPATREPAAPAPAAPSLFVPKPLPVAFLYGLTSIAAAVMQGFGTSLISANLAQIAGPLEATQNEAAWLMAAYLVPNASLGLFLFKVRAQFGIRNFCEIAIIPYVLISLAHLWVNDLGLSIALRFFAGAAAAPISSVAFLYMLEIFPPEKKLSMGQCLALIGLSLPTPIAGLISPTLLDHNGLQSLYLLELGLALLVFGLIYILPLTSPPRAKVISSMDFVSYGLLAASMGCFAVFFTMGRLYWWLEADWLGWLLAAGIASGSLMIMLELNRKNNLIDVRWISSWEIVHFAGVLLVFRMLLTEQSTGAINFMRQLGLFNEQMTGLYWAILIASVLSGLFCALVIKPGREAVIHFFALVLIATGSYMDSYSTVLTRPEQMYLSQSLIAFGSGLFLPPAMAVGFAAALKKGITYIVSFLAIFLFTQKVGAFIGSALFGTFVTWREQYHSAILTSRMFSTDPLVTARINQYVSAYARSTPDSLQRTIQGTSTFAKQVQQQAYVLAYNDAFFCTFLIAIAAIVILLLNDYQKVKKGDLIARIDDRIYAQKLEQAKASLSSAEAALANSEQSRKSAEAKIVSAKAAVESANAAFNAARTAYERTQNLLKSNISTQSDFEKAQATYDQAAAAVHQAEAAELVAEQDLNTIVVNRRSLEATVEGQRAAVQLAEIDLQNTRITSPQDGRLGEVTGRLGQYVSVGTQIASVVPDRVWVVANYKETQLKGMVAGQIASFTVDALGHQAFTGRIVRFAPATGSEFSVIKSDNATGNFTKVAQRIPVRIEIEPNQPLIDQLVPGMSVVASVDLAQQGGAALAQAD
eukprot:g3880.t1